VSFFKIVKPLDVIVIDREFCKESDEVYGLDHPDIFQNIINEYNAYDSLQDEKEKAIQKATCFLAGLVFEQPFKNGNKRTALSVSRSMMKSYNFTMKGYETDAIQEEVYNLLENTMLKIGGDPTIKTEIEEYLRENLIKI